MHLRIARTQRKGKTYQYVQLVESYRREDGMPAHRVIANLGDLPAKTVENLRVALQAGRQGAAVVVESAGQPSGGAGVKANLRYLDLAVLLDVWRWLKLDVVIQRLLANGRSLACHSDVVAALVLQRCVAPRSKLYASEWYPTTAALPELTGVMPPRFNNTRLHRVLLRLDQQTEELQSQLPQLYEERHGAFTALFLDTTDTYFEGRQCELSKRSRTKAGHDNKRTIGIVLLANQDGYPMRWKVVEGRTKDHLAMGGMIESLKAIDWARGVPIVLDRAMGNQCTVELLIESGLHFLTAAHVDAIESYTSQVPADRTSVTVIKGTDESYNDDIETLRQVAREIGMEQVTDYLFVTDLGVVEVDLLTPEASEDGTKRKRRRRRNASGTTSARITTEGTPGPRQKLRLVAYFNPMMFVDQRRRIQKHLNELNKFVADLNKELAEARQSRKQDATRRKIDQQLEKRNWLDLFEVTLNPIKVPAKEKPLDSFRCELKLNDTVWAKKMRYNGFVLLLGHPLLAQSARELALLYRAKDKVEKDFQTIKSVVKLRPIFHYTNPKVQAHVTLCMLALLVQRALEHRLRSAELSLTAPAALELLGTSHLNLLATPRPAPGPPVYTVTQVTQAQREILQTLSLSHLADTAAVATRMIPRVVST